MNQFEKTAKNFDYIEDEEKRKLAEKFEKNKPLGVTAEDFSVVGGTVPDELKRLSENPGKTMAELMNDKELEEWLDIKISELRSLLEDETENHILQQQSEYHRKHIKNTIQYLREIGRLPKEYENYNVDQELESQQAVA